VIFHPNSNQTWQYFITDCRQKKIGFWTMDRLIHHPQQYVFTSSKEVSSKMLPSIATWNTIWHWISIFSVVESNIKATQCQNRTPCFSCLAITIFGAMLRCRVVAPHGNHNDERGEILLYHFTYEEGGGKKLVTWISSPFNLVNPLL
jgi:hypothetical protein